VVPLEHADTNAQGFLVQVFLRKYTSHNEFAGEGELLLHYRLEPNDVFYQDRKYWLYNFGDLLEYLDRRFNRGGREPETFLETLKVSSFEPDTNERSFIVVTFYQTGIHHYYRVWDEKNDYKTTVNAPSLIICTSFTSQRSNLITVLFNPECLTHMN